MNRRNFLKAGSASIMATSVLNMASLLSSKTAYANEGDDYKALVCVFLYGGMDNHDTIIPYDQPSYDKWAQIRSSLLPQYSNKRSLANLLPLNASAIRFGQRKFALPPEMTGLQQLYQQGNMAVIGNVGPMIEATTAASFNAQTAKVPSRLFSHNDQQSIWMSGNTEGAQYGWAGQVNDSLIARGIQESNTFSAITTSGGELLLTGENTTPYHVEGGRAITMDIIEENDSHFSEYLVPHLSAAEHKVSHLLQQDLANKINQSYNANSQYNQAVDGSGQSDFQFPNSHIGQQLASVAKTIGARNQLQGKRQIFVVSMGGFDTHSAQAKTLPKLQSDLDQAILAFQNAMDSMEIAKNVTLFTGSDFGRTLAANGDGTDHGWGSHHFVVGGAVQGGQIFGDIPVSELNHQLDAGSGRLIPTTSVDQYAACFGNWMGLDESDLNNIFPNLTNLGQRPDLFKS